MAVEMTTPGAAGWIEFSGPNAAEAKKFYADVMGWTINDMPMEDGSSYTGLLVGDEAIGGVSPMPADAGSWTIYVTVPDVDSATEKARKAGATITAAPFDAPGVGRISKIIDPQGASIAMITYESMQA
ncbi:MAG: VOC family protein [Sneathiellales bacterium]|nr:VOC family protein [Sneathiellales bacterium]